MGTWGGPPGPAAAATSVGVSRPITANEREVGGEPDGASEAAIVLLELSGQQNRW